MIRQRITWLDQLRGIAMFSVVIGHVALPKEAISLIYSFHMPLFFIISGMTVNDGKLLNADAVKHIKDKACKLIIPYFWMSFMMFPLWFITYHKLDKISTTLEQVIKGIFYGNNVDYHSGTSNALWFLLTLFFADILYLFIVKLSKNDEGKKALLVIACGIIGYLDKGIAQMWHFNVAFTAVVFIYIGKCIMSAYKSNKEWFDNKYSKGKYLLIAVLLAVWYCSHKFNGRISVTANKFGNSVISFYVTALAFSLAAIMIVIMLPKISFFEYVGKNTLLYVGVHVPLIRFFQKAVPDYLESSWSNVLLAVGVYVAMAGICVVFNRIFPYVCGKSSDDKLVEIAKYPFVFVCTIIPMLAFYQKISLFETQAAEKLAIVITSMIFSVVFVLLTNRYAPVIYAKKPKT